MIGHGGSIYPYLQSEMDGDEGLIREFVFSTDGVFPSIPLPEEPHCPIPPFRYFHLFGKQTAKDLPSEQSLEDLGSAMVRSADKYGEIGEMPAGYTYFAQLVFHDLTWFDQAMDNVASFASPALDFDSILGNTRIPAQPAKGCPVKGPWAVGLTTGTPGSAANFPLPEDIPREPLTGKGDANDKANAGKPLLPDVRNDDFLSLAQTHLALIKFLNAIAHWFGFQGESHFNKVTKRNFVEHVQAVVLFDWLQRLVDPDVYQDILKNGRRILHPAPVTELNPLMIPLEFAAAAARFGHTMIRDQYFWNADHQFASLGDFMRFSHRNSGTNASGYKMVALQRDWIIDWSRFYDFSAIFPQLASPMLAHKINTQITAELGSLCNHVLGQPCGGPPPAEGVFNLAVKTLTRQRDLSLVSAQVAIQQMNRILGGAAITPLTSAQIAENSWPAIEQAFRTHPSLAENTPIWYYVLREAETHFEGNRLGPMGSRLVMETVHASLEAANCKLLIVPDWRPGLPSADGKRFTMADLICFAGNPDPLNSWRSQT